MERSLKLHAVVLHHTNYGEADRFITFLSEESGKVTALAKGVRKIKSHKAGHLEPFNYVSLQLSKGRGPSWIIEQAAAIETYPLIGQSLNLTGSASYTTELADRFASEETENRALFRLVLETLRRIESLSDIFPAMRHYDLNLLSIAGYQPQLQHCVCCGREIQPVDQFFSFSLGGVVCPNCIRNDSSSRRISMRTLKYFRYYQNHSFQEACQAGWPEDIRFESETILTSYISFILERKINSQQFLEHVHNEQL